MKLAGLKSVVGAHDVSLWCAAWVSPTESRPSLLLTGSLDESVRLWRGDDLVIHRTNSGHSLGVVSVASLPSGVFSVFASLDSLVRIIGVVSNNTTAATLKSLRMLAASFAGVRASAPGLLGRPRPRRRHLLHEVRRLWLPLQIYINNHHNHNPHPLAATTTTLIIKYHPHRHHHHHLP